MRVIVVMALLALLEAGCSCEDDGPGPSPDAGAPDAGSDAAPAADGGPDAAGRSIMITAIDNQTAVVGLPFSLVPSVTGMHDALTFSSVGTDLPAWASLDASTGEISGTPDRAALAGNGILAGLQIQATDGAVTGASTTFAIAVTGVALPDAELLLALDGDATDQSGNGHDGVNTGVAFSAGAVDDAGDWEGDPDQITVPDDPGLDVDLDDSWSVVLSVRRSMGAIVPAGENVLSKRALAGGFEGYGLIVLGTGMRAFLETGAGLRTVDGTLFDDDAWHSYVVTNGGTGAAGELRIYTDGVLEDMDTTGASGTPVNGEPFVLGGPQAAFAGRAGFRGSLDEVALFRVALDEDQAATVAWLSRVGVSLSAWIARP